MSDTPEWRVEQLPGGLCSPSRLAEALKAFEAKCVEYSVPDGVVFQFCAIVNDLGTTTANCTIFTESEHGVVPEPWFRIELLFSSAYDYLGKSECAGHSSALSSSRAPTSVCPEIPVALLHASNIDQVQVIVSCAGSPDAIPRIPVDTGFTVDAIIVPERMDTVLLCLEEARAVLVDDS